MHDKKRTITIDPTLHSSLSKKSARNGKRNKSDAANTIKPRPFIRATTLKKTLLDKIKRHQQQQQQQQQQKQHNVNSDVDAKHNNGSIASAVAPTTVIPDDTFAQTFQDSLLYLQNLSANKKTAKAKLRDNKKISSSIASTSSSSTSATGPDVNLGAYPSEFANTVVPSVGAMMSMQPMQSVQPMQPMQPMQPVQSMYPPILMQSMQPINGSNEIDDPPGPPIKINSEPVWGCLKNGSKPTFRTLNGTLKNATGVPPYIDNNNNNNNNIQLNISDISNTDDVTHTHIVTPPSSEQVEVIAATNKSIESTYGARKQRLDEYKREHFEAALKNQQPVIKIRETKQQIITKKYKLGKYVNKQGPVIGVLIKNRQTQYNVEKKRNEMRHIPLHTIKSRLHKKNLLKVGSIAPPDILREMYENAVFAGDIENDGEGILLHNFLASASESETETSHNK